jgi:hypothetical protein
MKSLKECTTIQEAMPLIRGKPETFRTLVETAYTLKNHPNPAQQAIGDNFLSKAIREMDADEQPTPHHDDGVKPKGDHFVKEEELPGGNKSGTEGSEQSSSSKPKEEGTTEPDGDMESPGMSTENQMTEVGQMPPMSPMTPPGLDPSLVQQLGAGMPQPPPMTMPQQVQQMQYTVKEYLKPVLNRMAQQEKHIKYQQEAIKVLTAKVQETVSLKNGLDLNGFKERQILPKVQETLPQTVTNLPNIPGTKIYEKSSNLEVARSKITEINNLINSTSKQQPYQ